MSSHANRVVITGLGAISCLGIGAQAQYKKAINCSSGITPFQGELPIDVDLTCAGTITDPLPKLLDPSASGMFDRVAQLSWIAVKEALDQAGMQNFTKEDQDRSGIFWGTGFGGATSIDNTYQDIFLK